MPQGTDSMTTVFASSVYGTCVAELVRLRKNANVALDQALATLRAMAPNARDYVDSSGFESARARYREWVAQLDGMRREITRQAVALQRGE